jgi:alpha-glucosidase/alpha-D-xyloside xylohydrolase
VSAPAPLHAIPVWVRNGAIVVTHPAPEVRQGLGEGDGALHATLWGTPRCGRALARLADGTVVGWRRGRWTCCGRADVTFEER